MRELFIYMMLSLLVVDFAFSDSPIQKPLQKPKDRPVQVVTDYGELCYIPTFSFGAENGSYIGILNCSIKGARAARYDVFGRIAYYINDTWQCITAPESVATYGKGSDYLYLSPCVINDPKQKWKIKDRVFYGIDGSYSIQDDGSYLYAVDTFGKKLDKHKLSAAMDEWINTIAIPGNISIVTSLSWELQNKAGGERYFLYNNASDKNTTPLYYNFDKGYIAQYNALAGTLDCMYSNVGSSNWNWINWKECNDAVSNNTEDGIFWKPVRVSGNKFAFEDKDGNILRLTRYGAHWGVPYAVKSAYLTKDTGKSPTSEFLTDDALSEWTRFINANAGKNLQTCPAGRSSQRTLKQSPLFPANFHLSNEWIQRLYAISQTTAGTGSSGFCGTCLLQSYQMIAELLENPYQPRPNGGYFFDTAINTNPFISFRARNSILHDTLADISEYVNRPLSTVGDSFYRTLDRAYAGSIAMLPQYEWNLIGRVDNPSNIDSLLARVFSASRGARIYLAVYIRRNISGTGFSVHSMVLLGVNNGVIAIPTNISTTREAFTQSLTPARNTSELHTALARAGSLSQLRPLLGLGIFEVGTPYRNEFESIISMHDCAGEGEGRRGSRLTPLPELLNQCISGRCF